ncbi:hypothetical protein [Haliangium sp.]|uniref:hypothetical protein n=1 Tax=Haliangium sp. TaxID=2663208 RepID=UPI003D0A9066
MNTDHRPSKPSGRYLALVAAGVIASVLVGCARSSAEGQAPPAPSARATAQDSAPPDAAPAVNLSNEASFDIYIRDVAGTLRPYACPGSGGDPIDMLEDTIDDDINDDTARVVTTLHDYCPEQLSKPPEDCDELQRCSDADTGAPAQLDTIGCDIKSDDTIEPWNNDTQRHNVAVPLPGKQRRWSLLFCAAADTTNKAVCPSKVGAGRPTQDGWCSPDPIMIIGNSGGNRP